MSFLNQLKSQAHALQSQRSVDQAGLDERTTATEAACRITQAYLQDLARQLDVIMPAAPAFTLDGKTPWPAMKLCGFRVDARRKMLRNKEVTDYIAVGWQVLPQLGKPVGGVVTVQWPPDLERVETRLALGRVQHERKEQRHPEKNTLQALRFEYLTETRGNITVTPDHDNAQLQFRLLNLRGFESVGAQWPAERVKTDVLDELAKLVVGQPSRFL